jgi:hypothetical protein
VLPSSSIRPPSTPESPPLPWNPEGKIVRCLVPHHRASSSQTSSLPRAWLPLQQRCANGAAPPSAPTPTNDPPTSTATPRASISTAALPNGECRPATIHNDRGHADLNRLAARSLAAPCHRRLEPLRRRRFH